MEHVIFAQAGVMELKKINRKKICFFYNLIIQRKKWQ